MNRRNFAELRRIAPNATVIAESSHEPPNSCARARNCPSRHLRQSWSAAAHAASGSTYSGTVAASAPQSARGYDDRGAATSPATIPAES